MRICVAIAVVILLAKGVGIAQTNTFDTSRLLDRLRDFEWLPVIDNSKSRQFSSWDRSGGNGDAWHYLSYEGNTFLMAEMDGPGAIVRIWSANPDGVIKVYIDHEPTPRIECQMADLFSGKFAPFRPPLATTSSGGFISYFPIPYAKHCKVVQEGGKGIYYHVNYVTFDRGANVRSFTRVLDDRARESLARTEAVWRRPDAFLDASRHDWKAVEIEPGRTVDVASLTGPRTITTLLVDAANTDDETLRKAVMRTYWDGQAEPAIESPISDFFASSFGLVPYSSLLLGIHGNLMYCRMPMPFQKSARFTIENGSDRPIGIKLCFDTAPLKTDSEVGYLNAQWHNWITQPGARHRLMLADGSRGHFIGAGMTMQGNGKIGVGFLEGDEVFVADGEKIWLGTGTEDYFNSGWYFSTGLVHQPLHALLLKDSDNISVFRMHLNDRVSWERSFDASIEHGGGSETEGCEYSSVAYWYQRGKRAKFAEVPPASKLAMPRRTIGIPPGYIGFAEMAASKSAFARVRTEPNDYRVSKWEEIAKAIRGQVMPMVVSGELTIEIEPTGADRGQLSIAALKRREDGPLSVSLNGTPLGAPIALGATLLDAEAVFVDIGAVSLKPGDVLRFATPDARPFALLALNLKSASPFVREWQISPSYLREAESVLNRSYAPETAAETIEWRSVTSETTGFLNLMNQFSPHENRVAYARAWVVSPDDRETELLFGSDDGAKIWLNDDVVFEKVVWRGALPDQEAIKVRLKKGVNPLLVKLENGVGGWGLFVRFRDPDGSLRFSSTRP